MDIKQKKTQNNSAPPFLQISILLELYETDLLNIYA